MLYQERAMSIYSEKNTKRRVSFKVRYGYTLSMMAFIVSVILVFCGLFIPPAGTISAGVLTAAGEFLSLCAVAAGFDTYFTIKSNDIESRITKIIKNG